MDLSAAKSSRVIALEKLLSKCLDRRRRHEGAMHEVVFIKIPTKEITMNIDKLAPILAVIVAAIATFVDMEILALILVLIGLVHGIMSPVSDHASQAMIIVAAALFPTIANNLDAIPAVGMYLNTFVDQFAVAIAGYAIAALINEVKSRILAD